MAASISRLRSRSQSRCCSCMKNGRCIRCQCVKNCSPCIDCWPSLTNPKRCENSGHLISDSVPLVARPSAEVQSIIEPSIDNRDGRFTDSSASLVTHTHPTDITTNVHGIASEVTDHHVTVSEHGVDSTVTTTTGRCVTSSVIQQLSSFLSQPRKILKRIPRLSRTTAARKLASIIQQVISRNDVFSWSRLLQFPRKCLYTPPRGGKRWKLSSIVNNQISQEASDVGELPSNLGRRGKPAKPHHTIESLAARVSSKLEEGNYRGAVRLACSEDVLAEHSDSIHEALRLKHPPPHADSSIDNLEQASPLPFPIDADLIMKSIISFLNGSGGGTRWPSTSTLEGSHRAVSWRGWCAPVEGFGGDNYIDP